MSKITTTKEWSDAAIEHMRKLEEEDKYDFVHSLIFDLALFGGASMYETLGMLEAIKSDLIESFKHVQDGEPDCENCDDRDCPDHPDNKK
jgi:hypothetical protein